ncbi:hypothetical protein [Haladaptatus sp. DJG-WS-42]|uniref:hypothetical protein n=1 Tax=Haladaptatus sp. DJG-WS-42 TaxID=3120516 RepID=UPI0030CC38D8
MASFLIVYATGQGQTAKIAAHIGATLSERGHTATVLQATEFAAFVAGRIFVPSATEGDGEAVVSTPPGVNRRSSATKLGLLALVLIGLWIAGGRYGSRQC